jgi:hypothetical protein
MKTKKISKPSQNNTSLLRIVGDEQALEHWSQLFQILEEDKFIEVVDHSDKLYKMRGGDQLRHQYWEIKVKFYP